MEKEKLIYKLPEGWIWTTIGEIAVLSSGGTPSRGNSSYFRGDIPWVKSGELNYNIITDTEEKITQEALISSSAKIIPANALLIALYGSTVGKIAKIGIEAATNQAVASIITFPHFNQDFLYYYLLQNREKLLKKRKGGAQPNISQRILSDFPLPLPSIKVQNNIVSKIETLFSELDQAEKGLQKVQQQLKTYRQALLKSAFEGNLTTRWRNENNTETSEKIIRQLKIERQFQYEQKLAYWNRTAKHLKENESHGKRLLRPKIGEVFKYNNKGEFEDLSKLPPEWKWVHWNEILDFEEGSFKRGPFGSALTKSMFVQKGYKVYEQYCPINDDCSFERYFITTDKYEELKSFAVKEGDYLISCSGTLGRITQVPKDFREGIINQALLRVRVNKKYVDNRFFLHFFRSPYFQKQIFANLKGSAIPNIKGVNELKIIPIPLLSISEQEQIVEILESRFTLIENFEKIIKKCLSDVTLFKHSILKKAFEGWLVNKDSNNESANVLLHEIKKEKEEYLKAQKELEKHKPQKKRQMDKKKTVFEILKESKEPISAQELWTNSIHDGDIESFYSEIKEIYSQIIEVKEETESLLSLNK